MMQICVLAALILAFTSAVVPKHHRCDFQGPGGYPPGDYGYLLFCAAAFHKVDDNHARYICDNTTTQVADWNYLAPQVLEIGTPCGDGGFGNSDQCYAKLWGICFGDSKGIFAASQGCRYLGRKDDCEWLQHFEMAELPPYIYVFRGQWT